jgi:hypothetical protein
VLQVGVLLGAAEALAALGLRLLLALLVLLGLQAGALGLVLGDALGLGLLRGGGGLGGLFLGLGGLACLFALDFGVFGGVPGVEDLQAFRWRVSSHAGGVIGGEVARLVINSHRRRLPHRQTGVDGRRL